MQEVEQLQQEINKLRPFNAEQLQQIKEYFRIGLTYSSNALEGNSLTETETKIILEDGITIGGKRLVEHLEALGHSQAYDFIYSIIDKQEIAQDDIKQLHHLFYYRIDEKNAGVYRKSAAIITGSKYALPKPQELDSLMSNFIQELNQLMLNPVELAAFAHKNFVFIHPFVDGNGRVSRLLMNLILIKHGYLPTIISPVLRHEYIRLLEKAHENDAEFIEFIAKCLKETQKDFLRLFR